MLVWPCDQFVGMVKCALLYRGLMDNILLMAGIAISRQVFYLQIIGVIVENHPCGCFHALCLVAVITDRTTLVDGKLVDTDWLFSIDHYFWFYELLHRALVDGCQNS